MQYHRGMIVHRPPFIIHQFATLGSTNDWLKQQADAPEFTCAVAEQQTAGRGRRDRSWHSSPGDGLYLSVLLRPPKSAAKIPLLSLMTAVAVAETMTDGGVPGTDIKWPNDVLARDRKLCGILIEGASAANEDVRLIVGIGVNLNHQSFPEELRQTATSVRIETGLRTNVDAFRDALLANFAAWYERWKRGDAAAILERWQRLSSYARGRHVIVMLDHEQFSGETAGLNDDGALLVRDGDELRTVLAGDVTRLR